MFLAAGIAVSACAAAPSARHVELARSEPVPETEGQEGLAVTRFIGPGLVCGIGFALELLPDEKFTRYDRMMDFVTYRLEAPERAALIYEGNFPEAADALIKTGRDFPALVALHLEGGGYDKALAGRILTRSKVPPACRARSDP